MARKKGAILEPLLAKAIGLGADQLEVEYKDGSEEVFAMKSGVGLGIASFRSSSPEAKSLRNELYAWPRRGNARRSTNTRTSCVPVSLTASARMLFAWNCDVSNNWPKWHPKIRGDSDKE